MYGMACSLIFPWPELVTWLYLPAREMVNALLPFENSVLERGIHALVHGSLVKSAASCDLIGEE